MGEWLYLIIGIAVVAIGLTAGLLTSGRRRKPGEPAPPKRPTDVISPPRDESDVPVADDLLVDEPPADVDRAVEKPETTASRLVRLRQRLAGAQGGFGRGLLALLSRERLDEDTWEAIEDTLLTADVGVAPTQELVEGLRTRMRVAGVDAGDAKEVLREELVKLVGPDLDRRLQVSGADGHPGVVLVVGVNGTGKTTTVGKLARILVAEDKSVVLGAADTFRAAAVEQLATWGERVGVEVIRGRRGRRSRERRLRRRPRGRRARRRHRHRRHRRASPEQGRPDGRARQGQAGHREGRSRHRGAPRPRRHHRAERHDPGPRVRRGRRRHGHRAHQARRFRQGRHRGGGPARARRTRQAGRARRGARRPGAVRRRGRSWTRCWADAGRFPRSTGEICTCRG